MREFGRLSGIRPGSAAVIRLETSFGGGKTHNLIALFHLCSGSVSPKIAAGFVSPELIPSRAIPKIAGVVGPDMDVRPAWTTARSARSRSGAS